MLLLSPDHVNKMRAHAEATYPQECCGLLVGTLERDAGEPQRRVSDAIATANAWSEAVGQELTSLFASAPTAPSSHHSKADRYWIDPKDMLRVQRQARERHLNIVGVYHSHPDHVAVPSECDRTIAWKDYSYVILAVHQGHTVDIQSWALNDQHQFQAERMGGPTPDLLYPPTYN